ncbi:response regulator transcription factor [Conexibacter sp. CPCC 206217]|uniref:response regulator n=1 Tax=Conexibacter sp. CPCC 206217 TaxID=3064574 RepID=UPI00272511DA|nr:response regulator transcription factor [Conexibacter sp. CPCC 206217]MDO8213332.1 response regulator transcription factor [Conexibacter sp. CPCC 206217]
MIRVVVADDMALVRGGMKMILEADPGIRVVGEAGDGADAVEQIIRTGPDVAVMDIRMPGTDGIEATRRLQRRMPGVRVLVVTTFHLDEYVHEALRAGAAGFLLKDTAPDSLVGAVRTVAAGDALLSPAVTRQLIEHYVQRPTPDEDLTERLAELTPREVDVARLVARGMTNAEIARELFLGEGTVKTHVTAILSKLGLRNRTQIVVAAYESGLVELGSNELPG